MFQKKKYYNEILFSQMDSEISRVSEGIFNHNNVTIFAGFSEEQAEGLTMSLVEIITSSVLDVTGSTVSKIDQVH